MLAVANLLTLTSAVEVSRSVPGNRVSVCLSWLSLLAIARKFLSVATTSDVSW